MASVQERRMIGPSEAAEILKMNTGNRKVDSKKVHFYARQMREGRWRDTGIPIIIYRQGQERLLDDGQHRLYAIIECGLTLPMTISVVDERVVAVVDQGKNRSLGDLIAIDAGTSEGVTDKRAAAVAIAVDRWQRARTSTADYLQYSAEERRELLDKYPRQASLMVEMAQRYKREFGRLPHAGYLAGILAVDRAGRGPSRFFDQILLAESDATVRSRSSMVALFKLCANPPEVIHGQFPVIARTWNNWVVDAWNRREEPNVEQLRQSRAWIDPDPVEGAEVWDEAPEPPGETLAFEAEA